MSNLHDAAHDIAHYLHNLGAVILTSRPCVVTVKGTAYAACHYTEQLNTPTGTEAYRRGERTYTREAVYYIGTLPNVVRRGNVAFTLSDDGREWYVSAYSGRANRRGQERIEPNEGRFNPFGNMFLLDVWTHAEQIDHCARVPYSRVPAKIAYL